MKLEVLNIQGEKTGRSLDLPEEIFGVEPNEHVVYLAVKQYLANRRQGTHMAKERSDVKGSTRKIKKQKGTGTARFGDIKNPLFRGGGRMFGPRPRSYNQKMNKKVKTLARKSALSSKAKAEQIMLLEDFTFDSPKTSEFNNILKSLNVAGQKTLLVLGDYDQTLIKSSRNIPKTNISLASDLNVYEMLNANYLIFSESGLEQLKNALA